MASSACSNPAVGIGGAYGSWGESYDNEELPRLYEQVTGEALANEEKFNLAELGFLHRQHIPALSEADNLALEVEVGRAFCVRLPAPAAGSRVRWTRYWWATAGR